MWLAHIKYPICRCQHGCSIEVVIQSNIVNFDFVCFDLRWHSFTVMNVLIALIVTRHPVQLIVVSLKK